MSKKLSLTDKGTGDLLTLLKEKREELRKLRFEAAGARPKDTNAPGNVRKDIARILTELGARTK